MNLTTEENEFRRNLTKLFEDIKKETSPTVLPPFEREDVPIVHEHDTRTLFFDRLLEFLGWSLGSGGNIAQEARIRAGTVKFLDYVGLHDVLRTPNLIVEAKAWDKPFVRARDIRKNATSKQLIKSAIEHLNGGGEKKLSPVSSDWHEYLEQVATYIKAAKQNYSHDVPAAVLGSGQWLVVFTAPVDTFIEKKFTEEDIHVFFGEVQILEKCESIYRYLAKRFLALITPETIYPAQIAHYFQADELHAVYHAVEATYQSRGGKPRDPIPQISIFAEVILQRVDGALFRVVNKGADAILGTDSNEDGNDFIGTHYDKVAAAAADLLADCAKEFGSVISPCSVNHFPGFPTQPWRLTETSALGRDAIRDYARLIKGETDKWVIVTGEAPHYILREPIISCRFHNWSDCKAVGKHVGPSGIGTAVTMRPRSFFTDGQLYHCAHQEVIERRENCHIESLDARTCCRACALQHVCWKTSDPITKRLPCGQ